MATRRKAARKPTTRAKTKLAAKSRKTQAKVEASEVIEIVFETEDTEPISAPPVPAKPKIDERRRNSRHAVAGLSGTFLFSTEARIIDLSLDGMALETSAYLQIGRSYSLKLDHKKLGFPLRGVVKWCSLKRTTRDSKGDVVAVYRAGIKFENIFADKAKSLLVFLEENAEITLEEEIRGRFKLPKGQSAGLTGKAEFSVTTISLSGMSVECSVPLAIDDAVDLDLLLGESSVAVAGRIASSREVTRDEGQSSHHIGIEFVAQTAKSKKTLESFLQGSSK